MEQYVLILPLQSARAESWQVKNENRQNVAVLLQILKGKKVKSQAYGEYFVIENHPFWVIVFMYLMYGFPQAKISF